MATTAALVFGIVTPILCLIMDPGVVIAKGTDPTHSLARGIESFGLAWVALQMGLLVLWLVLGRRLRRLSGWWAGGLGLGAALAWLLAIAILPYSLLAMTVGMMLAFADPRSGWAFPVYGLLGLSVFLTGSVYFSQAKQAADLALDRHSIWGLLWRAFLGIYLVIVLSILAQVAVDLNRPNAPAPAAAGG